MATPSVLTFDAEGRAVAFEVWVDDLQLFLQCDRADGLSMFDLTSGASPAPPATADSTSLTSLRTCALVTLATALRFLLSSVPRTPPPMYITLYYIVTRLPDSIRLVRDHFLSVCPTTLTVDLLEQRLLAAETSIIAVGASHGDPRTPVYEGRSELHLPLAGDAAPAGARGARALVGLAGAVEVVVVVAVEGVGVLVGVVAGVEVSAAAMEAEEAVAVAEGAEVAEVVEFAEAAEAAVELVAALRRGVAPVAVSASSSSAVVRPRHPSSFVSDTLGVSAVGILVPAPTFSAPATALFPDATEIPRWGDLSRAGVAIFDLDYDAILAAMYAVSTSDEGDCYLCFPPDPGGEAAALGACEAAALGAGEAGASTAPGAGEVALSGTASAQVFYTFTLESDASRSFFRDRTTLTPLSRPVAVSLADPSGGPVLASFSTVLPCPAAPSGTWCLPPLVLYELGRCVESGVFAAASGSGPESAPCSCRLLSHQTLLLHHRLGHPSLPRLRGMASRVLGHERYFLLVVDDYSRDTTVFPLRSKGDVVEVLIDWIRAARLQLRESFGSDFPVLRLHSDRGGEFSSARLGAFCRAQSIRQTFTLPASPQQNGIAERRIGMYAAHQLNLQPRVSLPETSPTLRWTGKVGDASAFRVWGSQAFVRDLSADKLSPRAVPCVFLGFPPDAPGWQFYHPTSRHVLSFQDITFDESVPFYRLFPYHTAPLPPPPLFLAPLPPPVNPLPPQGSAPSGVSQVDAVEPVEVAVDSGAAGGAEPGGAESGGAESAGAESGGAESGGPEPGGTGSGGAELGGAESARVASRSPSSRRELLSPQELREWFARRWSRAAGAGGPLVGPGPGGARPGITRAVGTGGAAAAAGVGSAGASGAAGAGATEGVGAGVGSAGVSTGTAP
ncbi:unnamed protein product, partial [Closterium sp. NIES-53]